MRKARANVLLRRQEPRQSGQDARPWAPAFAGAPKAGPPAFAGARRGVAKASLLLSPLLLLTACNLSPVYQGGRQGAVAQQLAGVSVAPIPGRGGWLVRNAIADRLAPMNGANGAAPRYRLEVELDDEIEGLGVRANDIVTRERRTLRARYRLYDSAAAPDEAPLFDRTASADAGIDVASSEYATIAAEDSALERLAVMIADDIVARLSLRAKRAADQ